MKNELPAHFGKRINDDKESADNAHAYELLTKTKPKGIAPRQTPLGVWIALAIIAGCISGSWVLGGGIAVVAVILWI